MEILLNRTDIEEAILQYIVKMIDAEYDELTKNIIVLVDGDVETNFSGMKVKVMI